MQATMQRNKQSADSIFFDAFDKMCELSDCEVFEKEEAGDPAVTRTGTVWTACAHILTAVVGSGVLSLPWSVAQLGWIGGSLVMVFFSVVTFFASIMLANSYRYPDPVTGKRNATYINAVKANLGGLYTKACGIIQYSNLWGIVISYTITAGASMMVIKSLYCPTVDGHDNDKCYGSQNVYMAMFGGLQIIFSQIPNIAEMWWLSVVATIMAFSYCLIGLGLAIVKAADPGHGSSYGTLSGTNVGLGLLSPTTKTWHVFQALGNISFAYSFSVVLIEIQDTLKSPPSERRTMRKATLIGISITTAFYMSIGFVGYLAFANEAPGNMLTGFDKPEWLVDFANTCIIVHLFGSYQICSQPIFQFVEQFAYTRWGQNKFIKDERMLKIPHCGTLKMKSFPMLWRTGYVFCTTIAAMAVPFFNDILGLIGACGFWPLTIYFPMKMYIKQAGIGSWTFRWILLQAISLVCLIVSLLAALGSIAGIVDDLKHYTPFG